MAKSFIINLPFTEALARKATLEQRYDATVATLKAIPGVGSGPMGLTPDAVKATREYKLAKVESETAAQQLRTYNAVFCGQFRKEYSAHRAAKREGA